MPALSSGCRVLPSDAITDPRYMDPRYGNSVTHSIWVSHIITVDLPLHFEHCILSDLVRQELSVGGASRTTTVLPRKVTCSIMSDFERGVVRKSIIAQIATKSSTFTCISYRNVPV